MEQYLAASNLATRFKHVRALCDSIWCDHAHLPEFDNEAVRNHSAEDPKIIWVHSKDGEAHVGDMLILGRLAPRLRALNLRLVCISNPSLPPLLAGMSDVFKVIPYTMAADDIAKQLASASYHSNWSNLLRRLDAHHPSNHTAQYPYISYNEQITAEYRRQYTASGAPLIGVCWRTSLIGRNPARDTSILEWSDILTLPHLNFISLQYGSPDQTAEDLEHIKQAKGVELQHDYRADAIDYLPRYASLVKSCDMVITVDCSTVFLAGGLGVTTRTLVPSHKPSFRWNHQVKCPYFPHNRVRRQTEEDSWTIPLSLIQRELMRPLRAKLAKLKM